MAVVYFFLVVVSLLLLSLLNGGTSACSILQPRDQRKEKMWRCPLDFCLFVSSYPGFSGTLFDFVGLTKVLVFFSRVLKQIQVIMLHITKIWPAAVFLFFFGAFICFPGVVGFRFCDLLGVGTLVLCKFVHAVETGSLGGSKFNRETCSCKTIFV